jgi:prepilin-type N-terminal cleavage/methylation domain-containing protein
LEGFVLQEYSNRSNDQGFTLIELLITLTVLSFGLLGLAGLQVQIVRANAFNTDMTIATTLGTGLIEEAKAAGYASLAAGMNQPVTFDMINNMVDLNGDGVGDDPYNGRFTISRDIVDQVNWFSGTRAAFKTGGNPCFLERCQRSPCSDI